MKTEPIRARTAVETVEAVCPSVPLKYELTIRIAPENGAVRISIVRAESMAGFGDQVLLELARALQTPDVKEALWNAQRQFLAIPQEKTRRSGQ